MMGENIRDGSTLPHVVLDWWRERCERIGIAAAFRDLIHSLWNFLLDSTPQRRRQRYGDVDYDWDFRVDTTSATVGWRDRLLGAFHSPYQPTEPALFHEMLSHLPDDLSHFVFLDIGSGKGRALLLASDYPFRRIIGIELLSELHRVALDNIRAYRSDRQCCREIHSLCADARTFEFPDDPLVLYLFNPLPESGLRALMTTLSGSLAIKPRAVWILYHNPLLEHVLTANTTFVKTAMTPQYVIYRSVAAS